MARGFARPEKYGRNAGVLGAGSDQSRARNESVNPSYSCSDCRELIPWATFRRWGGSLIIVRANLPLSRRDSKKVVARGAQIFFRERLKTTEGKDMNGTGETGFQRYRRASCAVRFSSAPALGPRVSKIFRPRGVAP